MEYKELAEQLNRKGLSNGSSLGHHSGLYDEAASAITELLERVERAERQLTVRERHGHWAHLGEDEWCCTQCGFIITTEGSWEKPSKKYCEECGARMSEEP